MRKRYFANLDPGPFRMEQLGKGLGILVRSIVKYEILELNPEMEQKD